MHKISTALIAGFSLLAGAAFAQGTMGGTSHMGGMGHMGGMSHSTSGRNMAALEDLIGANLHEAAVLRSQLPIIASDPQMTQVWQTMIQQHTAGARALARLDRSLGGHPDMTAPSVSAGHGTPRAVFDKVFQAHLSTEVKVRSLEASSGPRIRPAIHAVLNTVRHHIEMLSAIGLKRHWWTAGGPTNHQMKQHMGHMGTMSH